MNVIICFVGMNISLYVGYMNLIICFVAMHISLDGRYMNVIICFIGKVILFLVAINISLYGEVYEHNYVS